MPTNVITTARDLVTMSLKTCGAIGEGQFPSAENLMDAFRRMNWLLAQWRRKRWLVFQLLDLSVVSTGAQSYTVGPGGDIEIDPRPDKLEAAYQRQLIPATNQPVDWPLDIITSYEEYSRIPLKRLSSLAYSIFYDPGTPRGLIYPWPVPQASIYAIHILVKGVLQRFDTLDTQVTLPEEYEPAITYRLACILAPTYSLPVSEDMRAMAKDGENVLRQANIAISPLQIPQALIRPGIYDPYSDMTR